MHVAEHIVEDVNPWRTHATDILVDAIRDTITKRGRCTLGLSGGSTPAPIYRSLGQEAIDWSAVTIFLVDERCVPATDERSNQRLVRTHLLSSLTAQPRTIFPDTSLSPEDCADAYDRQLRLLCKDHGPDVLILGLGSDGHTASLFPPVSACVAPERFVIHTQTDVFDVRDRISVTPRVLQGTCVPIVLLQGEQKLTVWQTMMQAPYNPLRWPLHTVLAEGNAILIASRSSRCSQ